MTPINRPRVEGEREDQILDATVRLLLDLGYDRLTMDAVAKEAKASKATLYRRWESKAALVIDALIRAKDAPQVEPLDTGSLRGDLLGTFCAEMGPGSDHAARIMAAVVTAMFSDVEFAAKFRTQFLDPKIATVSAIYARARERGELREGLDLDVISTALPGILMHRSFVLGESNDAALVERVVDQLILPAVLAPETAARS